MPHEENLNRRDAETTRVLKELEDATNEAAKIEQALEVVRPPTLRRRIGERREAERRSGVERRVAGEGEGPPG